MLTKFLWTWTTNNLVPKMLMKYFPAITLWGLWKARCGDKYGKDIYNTRKTINYISTSLDLILKVQFDKIMLYPNKETICYLMISNISDRRIVFEH